MRRRHRALHVSLLSLLAVALPGPALTAQDAAAALALQRSGDHAAAAEAWRAVVEADPSNAAAWYNLGVSLHAVGDLEEALDAHEHASTFPSFSWRAKYNGACALARLGRDEEAFTRLEEAVEAGFANVALLRTDSDLDALRGDARFHDLVDGVGLPLPRRLHFWIGEWDCYSVSSGQLNGRNDLTARLGDTIVHETWYPVGGPGGAAAGGGPGGESWNYFDPASGTWRQHWMDPSGRPFVYVGTPKEDGILFEGPHLDGRSTPNRKRMFIRPIGGGRVQQTGTTTADGGATWKTEYDLVYVPRGERYRPSKASAETTPAPADPARQFDFLIGDWRMDVEQLDPAGNVIRRLTEWSRVRPRIGGAALIDEWSGSGFTVRTWDPRSKVWRLFWTDSAGSAGRMQLWEGGFEDGVGTFVGGTSVPTGDGTVTSRIEFSEIEDDACLWKMWKSPDGGSTWVLDYVRRYHRVSVHDGADD